MTLALALRGQWRGSNCGALRRACQAHHLRPNAAFDSMDITTFSKITEVLTASSNGPTPDSFWLQVSIRHLYPIFQRRITRKFTFYPAASAQSLPCPARDIQRREPVFETVPPCLIKQQKQRLLLLLYQLRSPKKHLLQLPTEMPRPPSQLRRLRPRRSRQRS